MKIDYYHRILSNLQKLKQMYPKYTMGRHLATMLDEQGDVWGMTDKQLSSALDQYIKTLSLDKPHEEKEIEQIIDEGLHLDIFKLTEEVDPPDEDYGS